MSWHRGPLVGFDLETTGTDPLEARIVTAAIVGSTDGTVSWQRDWLANPGIHIPAQASAIHGISSERAVAHGRPVPEVADEIAGILTEHWAQGVPVIAYNAAFDLTLLSAELDRHGLPSFSERLGGAPVGPVIDPLTVDRGIDRYRKGKRTLEAACAEYGVVLDGAHQAAADALAAVRVAIAIAERHSQVAALDLEELHRNQIRWYADWATGFQEFLRSKGNTDAAVDTQWPLRGVTSAV